MVELDATREGLYPSQEDAAGAVDYLIPAEMLVRISVHASISSAVRGFALTALALIC